MQTALQEQGIDNVHVEVFDSLPSTSEYLSELAKRSSANAKPHLCVADWQTNGNGRRGKSWVTERGNITFSLLLSLAKPPAELMGLSLVTGICIAESLAAQAGLEVNLKWPNDVLVGDRKLCGLLTELVSNSNDATQVVVGIGINYKAPADIEQSDYQAVSVPQLVASAPSRAQLIGDVTDRLLREYAVFEALGWSAFAQRWDAFDYLKGKQVRVISGATEERAVAVGVDGQGALLIQANGETRPVFSGDVSLRLA